ncbi:unnamed protein product, partial [Rotaria magnacalcarata]
MCVSVKPTKSYGIPGHVLTVGSLVLDPIESDIEFQRNPIQTNHPCALRAQNAYLIVN